jgi:hypothetical protein
MKSKATKNPPPKGKRMILTTLFPGPNGAEADDAMAQDLLRAINEALGNQQETRYVPQEKIQLWNKVQQIPLAVAKKPMKLIS